MNITIVLGTARKGRQSEKVAQSLVSLCKKSEHDISYVDVAEHVATAVTLPSWGEGGADTVSTSWKEVVVATDTFIFVLPEYNHSFPGEWKILMDSLFKEYVGKKVYMVTVGGGAFAGVRVMEHVIPVLSAFDLQLASKRLHIGNVSKIYSEEGVLSDDTVLARMQSFVDEVIKEA